MDKATKPAAANSTRSSTRPRIFDYHDYRTFLRDWTQFKKATLRKFSLRQFGEEVGFSRGFLTQVVSHCRKLTPDAAEKLAHYMELNTWERAYFHNLVQLGDGKTAEAKETALSKIQNEEIYRHQHRQEREVYQYLADWLNVAIREMVDLQGFEPTAEWIKQHLYFPAKLANVRETLDFLVGAGFLTVRDGRFTFPSGGRPLECDDLVYHMALQGFQRQIFSLAARASEQLPRDLRITRTATISMERAKFPEAKKIITKAVEELTALAKGSRPDLLCQFTLGGFALGGTETLDSPALADKKGSEEKSS
ncbi:MAG: TIGR02147 family protein [Bacteriovoracia bacterium]